MKDAELARETVAAAEQEMRDAKVPWLESPEELASYIADLIDRPHDYGTCVYAMSMAAVAAYNHVASKLGVTGFQASCADMDIVRRTRGYERFVLLDLGNALYPQYDLEARLRESLADARPWLAGEAKKLLAERHDVANPAVVAHWEKLTAEQVAA